MERLLKKVLISQVFIMLTMLLKFLNDMIEVIINMSTSISEANNMIKTRFTIAESTHDVSPLASTRGGNSPRRFKHWGWANIKELNNEIDRSSQSDSNQQRTPIAKKAKRILQMVDKPLNLGVEPLDDGMDDIYSTKIPVNLYSFIKPKKYEKKRPPPTYIEYNEYKETMKQKAYFPMKDLQE